MDREERIRLRAHAIWEDEGRPDGRDQTHWERAEREIGGESGEDQDGAGHAPMDGDMTWPQVVPVQATQRQRQSPAE
jgi:hypothetical protein